MVKGPNLEIRNKKENQKDSHLSVGIKPIMTCVGSLEDFNLPPYSFKKTVEERASVNDIFDENNQQSNKKLHNVDFYNKDISPTGSLTYGFETYVISPIDSFNKFSEEILDCTSLVVCGIDKNTNKQISFLTHQPPDTLIQVYDKHNDEETEKNALSIRQAFNVDLNHRLKEMKDRCFSGTIDAVIVGGNYLYRHDNQNDVPLPDAKNTERIEYLSSIKTISKKVKDVLGFEPIVVNGPKIDSSEEPYTNMESDSVYYDNANRRLYAVRPKVNSDIDSFTASTMAEHMGTTLGGVHIDKKTIEAPKSDDFKKIQFAIEQENQRVKAVIELKEKVDAKLKFVVENPVTFEFCTDLAEFIGRPDEAEKIFKLIKAEGEVLPLLRVNHLGNMITRLKYPKPKD